MLRMPGSLALKSAEARRQGAAGAPLARSGNACLTQSVVATVFAFDGTPGELTP